MANLFERLDKERPPPAEATNKQSRNSPPTLLDWLRNRWPETTVCARDIYRHAPSPIRGDRKIALDLAEALVGQGWLTPLKTHRHDRKAWRIVGKTGENAGLSQQLS